MCLSIAVCRPNDVLSQGDHCGLQWMTVQNGMGYRCGYVRLPMGHPWHGKGYDDINADVHGGLTFAEPDLPCDKGEPDDAYWLGFDCAHGGDAPDPALRGARSFSLCSLFDAEIRTQQYVEEECRSLCEQAIAAALP